MTAHHLGLVLWEQALVPTVQAIVISWTGIITAGAGYLFIRHQQTERRLTDLEARVLAFGDLAPLVRDVAIEGLKATRNGFQDAEEQEVCS